MSSKKDKFSLIDLKYMKLAINLARSRQGLTGKNPSVGCVITKKNQIISIGQTGINGRPHAESNAIKNCSENLKGAKMYISLEPCNHYGKTPPCTDLIIKSGIAEVFYSMEDIDKKVKGKSFLILKKKNIKVHKGVLGKEGKDLYRSYYINRVKKLPYITGKIAISKNYLIYSEGTKRITNSTTDKLTHYLRYKNDAILISSKTLNIDNPKLNCRINGLEKFSPKRIILDRNLKSNLKSFIFKTIKKDNTIIFFNTSNKIKEKLLKKKGIIIIKSSLNKNKQFDLKKIFKKLYVLNIRNLLIEGGDKITKNLLKTNLVNQFYLFKSDKILSVNKKHQFFTSFDILQKKYDKMPKIASKINNDRIIIYRK